MTKLLLALMVLTLAAASAAQDAEPTPEELMARIGELRVQAKYAEALEVARELQVHWESSPDASCTDLWRTEFDVIKLERALELPEKVRYDLAETESVLAEVSAVMLADGLEREHLATLFPAAERSLKTRRALVGEEDLLVAESLGAVGVIQAVQGDFDAAGRDLLRAAEIIASHLGEDHPAAVFESLIAGVFLTTAGQHEAAVPLVLRGLAAVRARGCSEPEIVGMIGYLAMHLLMWGQADSAEHLVREAVALQQRAGEDEEVLIELQASLVAILHWRGDYSGAERISEEILARMRALSDVPEEDVATSLLFLANMRLMEGDDEGAEESLHEALAAQRASGLDDPEIVLSCFQGLGLIYLERGGWEAAEEALREALSSARGLQGGENGYVSGILAFLAVTRSAQGDLEGAEQHAREALTVMRNLLGASNPQVSVLQSVLGHILYVQGHCGEAEGVLTEAAELYSTDVGRSTAEMGLLEMIPFAALAAARLELGRGDEAWVAVETALARSLADLLLASGSRALAPTERSREDSLKGAVSDLERSYSFYRERSRGDTTGPLLRRAETHRDALEEALGAWSAFRHEMATKYPFHEGQVLDLSRVQEVIPDRTALIGWLDVEVRGGTSRSWAYAVRRSGPVTWVELKDPLDERQVRLARTFRNAAADADVPALAVAREGQALWSERLGPLLDKLEGVDALIVVPSGVMLGIPLEAMVDDAGAFVCDRYAVSYAPSATTYAWLTERAAVEARPQGSALLVGDPVFAEDGRVTSTRDSNGAGSGSTGTAASLDEHCVRGALAGRRESISALPRVAWTRCEVRDVADILPGSTVLLGLDASEQELVRLAESGQLGDYAIIHIATHALVDDRLPSRSALVLSQVGLPDPLDSILEGSRIFDGLLTVSEILREWELDADLVTLSACQTGLGREVEGEGYIGLAHAFLQAGARSLLVSLWQVEDRATSLLVRRFYENRLGAYEEERRGQVGLPMSKAEALQEAKQWLRVYTNEHGNRPYEHPYYWSAFVLIGDRS